jgi:hypothetical protein
LQIVGFIFYTNLKDFLLKQRNDIIDVLHCEWKDTLAFWRKPDEELSKFKERTKGLAAGLPTTPS